MDFCVIIVEVNFDFLMNYMILEFLCIDNMSEVKVIGFCVLLVVVFSLLYYCYGLDIFGVEDLYFFVILFFWGFFILWLYFFVVLFF